MMTQESFARILKFTILPLATAAGVSIFALASAHAQGTSPIKPAAPANPGAAQAKGALSNLKASAKIDLEAAQAELAELRRQIEAEKVPLNQELNKKEEALIKLNSEYNEKRRQADVLDLDINNIAIETKVRSEENAYLSNILDEYVRGFETRIHPTEIEKYKKQVDEAKLATENPNLDDKQRFAKRLSILQQSMNRMFSLVGGLQFDAEVISANGVLRKGTVALVGPFAVFGDPTSDVAGVIAPVAGSVRPALRELDKELTKGIMNLATSGEGILPFDPTRGGAFSEILKKTSIVETFLHGGPIMWPILICSVIGLSMALERITFVIRAKGRRRPKDVASLFSSLEDGHLTKAVSIGKFSKDYVARMLAYALDHRDRSLQTALMRGTQIEIKRFTRGLWVLDTCITMAPLLGLLGTVTGMMASFEAIGAAGDASSGANAVIGGIAEALIATAAGLMVALSCLIPLNYMNEQIEGVTHELEDAGKQLEIVLHPPTQIVVEDRPQLEAGVGSSPARH